MKSFFNNKIAKYIKIMPMTYRPRSLKNCEVWTRIYKIYRVFVEVQSPVSLNLQSGHDPVFPVFSM